ncbi:MAG: translesion error-prone DNA polymerase V autoproteolytic subunit [Clostridiales bacterium]|nr:translesion error-prone DNA polymerase V autoproteolytic subunit [Clostridiales bacterium]
MSIKQSTSLEIYRPDFSTSLRLEYADAGIIAGFPSPAQDYINETIDLNKDLIRHPASTFYGRVVGDSMIEEGIEEGDILVIDKSLEPENGDLAVCCLDGEFTLKRINITRAGAVYLMPSNHRYKPIEVTPANEFLVWGIVVYTIKANRRRGGMKN